MPSTFTANTGIEKIADGEQTGLWGQTTNLNFDIVDRALNGAGAISLSGTTHTLTTSNGVLSDGQFGVLVFGGSPSGTNTVTIAPNTAQKVYWVRNTTAQSVVLTQGSGGNVTVPAGTVKAVYASGAGAGAAVVDLTNVLSMGSPAITGGTINGAVIGGTTPAAGTFTTLTASTSLTSPLVTNAGTLALSATGANVITASTNGSERLRVDSSGNVGIGTSSPNARLEVALGAEGEYLRVGGDNATNGRALRFTSSNSGGSNGALHTINASSTTGAIALATNSTERARIDASGNLLVGTTSVSGVNSVDVTAVWFQPNGAGVFTRSDGTPLFVKRYTSTGVLAQFNYSTNTVGNISTNGTSTAYNTSSDYRLKEDVQPMVGSVGRLMALKPVNFAWKVDGSRVDGFLAHEAQEVVPECVTGEKDAVDDEGNPQYQGIDQSKIVPLLVAALQEALTKIEALEARVAALEGV